ncbi:Alpha/Beta hydrolase protein [Rhypophila decipiens]|uniref:Alpha/Beta hydrolase protein n=1 Tax=Rhypophila decipiens TaxID=261697 RepID=A0AAN6Y1B1_9PEZI|nr:Alpha/Beta hydrolase protein [Rhypophila decipiens]
MRAAIAIAATASFLTSPATAQRNFVPGPEPDEIETVLSKKFPGASITYKSTNTLCETTPGVNSYSGYVHLPSSLLGDVPIQGYNASMFFWYFQARNNPSKAPLSIYISGGPGESSFDESSNFPCTVNPDSNSTTLNKDSWNTNVNMLYIDQPIGTGFSYSVIANGIRDLVGLDPERVFVPLSPEEASSFKQTNITVVPATISAPAPQFAINTTASAARLLWHFAQLWFQEFPEYVNKTSSDEISIWGNSYGGFYAPAIFAYFERQNDKISSRNLKSSTYKVLNLATIGLTNACIDGKIQVPFYPEFAYNNTYDIQAISEDVYKSAMTNFTMKGGCSDLIDACRSAGPQGDPFQTGANPLVNQACAFATIYCFTYVQGVVEGYSLLNPFDIALTRPTQYPVFYTLAFWNQAWVQKTLGVNVNHTMSSNFVRDLFFATGDLARLDYTDLEFLLKKGKNIVMVYGDRDFRCGWTGGEAVSLTLEHGDKETTDRFKGAGYADIEVEQDEDTGTKGAGVVRQAGKLSFSRVFDAGHNVGAYQPKVVYTIFDRAMNGLDIATGEEKVEGGYATGGDKDSSGIKNVVPKKPIVGPVCLVYQVDSTCTPEQVLALNNGTAKVEQFVVTEPSAGGEEDDDGGDDGNGNGNGPDNGNGNGQQQGGNTTQDVDKRDAALGRFGMMAGPVGVVGLVVALVVPAALFI